MVCFHMILSLPVGSIFTDRHNRAHEAYWDGSVAVVVERSALRILWHTERTSHLQLRANHSTTDPYPRPSSWSVLYALILIFMLNLFFPVKTSLNIKIGIFRLKLTSSRTTDQESPHSSMSNADNKIHNVVRSYTARHHHCERRQKNPVTSRNLFMSPMMGHIIPDRINEESFDSTRES